jgi:hypothetical protein
MHYHTGDILKVNSKRFPYIYHYGIVLVKNGNLLFIHNSPGAKNDSGGSLLVQNLNSWTTKNKVLSVQKTNTSKEKIIEAMTRNKSRKFNFFTFNSEHFVTEIKDGTPSSPQLRQWLYNLVGFIIIISMIRQNKLTVKNAFFTILRKI